MQKDAELLGLHHVAFRIFFPSHLKYCAFSGCVNLSLVKGCRLELKISLSSVSEMCKTLSMLIQRTLGLNSYDISGI